MEKVLILLYFLVCTSTYSQNKNFSINFGIDPKLLILGTDNGYTTHESVVNAHFKLEYHGRDNELYFAIGIEQANLREMYRAWFADFGVPIKFKLFNKDIIFTPQLEIGDIFREHVRVANYDSVKWDDTYYYGINIPFRHLITHWLAFELEGSLDRATDLPKRGWRYGGKFNLIIYLHEF
jgi:hypothetical protein